MFLFLFFHFFKKCRKGLQRNLRCVTNSVAEDGANALIILFGKLDRKRRRGRREEETRQSMSSFTNGSGSKLLPTREYEWILNEQPLNNNKCRTSGRSGRLPGDERAQPGHPKLFRRAQCHDAARSRWTSGRLFNESETQCKMCS